MPKKLLNVPKILNQDLVLKKKKVFSNFYIACHSSKSRIFCKDHSDKSLLSII